MTVHTGGRVRVAPSAAYWDTIYGYRWESRADWYDPARHDARFVLFDLTYRSYGTPEIAASMATCPTLRPRVPGISLLD